MRLHLDPGSIVRAEFFALARDARRRQAGTDAEGRELPCSCAHGDHVSCPRCPQPGTYRSPTGRIDHHHRGNQ